MTIKYTAIAGEFEKVWTEAEKTIAKAATAAMREAGQFAVARGRAHIAAAGFKDGYFPWRQGWQMQMFPRSGGDSLRATVRIGHKVGIASVFEHAPTIGPRTRGLMWLPLTDNLPAGWKRGGVRSGPKNFKGKLYSVNRPGRAPLLVGKPAGSSKNVPLFVGIKAAKMPKRFSLYAIIQDAADRLDAFYNNHLKVD